MASRREATVSIDEIIDSTGLFKDILYKASKNVRSGRVTNKNTGELLSLKTRIRRRTADAILYRIGVSVVDFYNNLLERPERYVKQPYMKALADFQMITQMIPMNKESVKRKRRALNEITDGQFQGAVPPYGEMTGHFFKSMFQYSFDRRRKGTAFFQIANPLEFSVSINFNSPHNESPYNKIVRNRSVPYYSELLSRISDNLGISGRVGPIDNDYVNTSLILAVVSASAKKRSQDIIQKKLENIIRKGDRA